METVHHRTIVPVRGRCHNNEKKADVSPSQTWVFVPGDCRERLPGNLKGVLIEETHGVDAFACPSAKSKVSIKGPVQKKGSMQDAELVWRRPGGETWGMEKEQVWSGESQDIYTTAV